jgi:hypothetical protein
LAFVIAITFVYALWWYGDNPDVKRNIRIEVTKSLLQLSIIVIIGGLVAALYKSVETERLEKQKQVERSREERQKRVEQLRGEIQKEAERLREKEQLWAEIRADYLKRLGVLYRYVKAARRSLRAAGLTTKFGKIPDTLSKTQANIYKEEMQHLNHAQLELEALKIEAISLPTLASIGDLKKHLEKMEVYLRQILNEYENICPTLNSGESIKFSQLEHLNEFTERTSSNLRTQEKLFKTQFLKPYDNVIKGISQHLI